MTHKLTTTEAENLIKEIQISREKVFPAETADKLLEIFTRGDSADIKKVAKECIDNPPQRMYAYIRNRLTEIRAEKEQCMLKRERWSSKGDCLGYEEFRWITLLTALVMQLHRDGYVETYSGEDMLTSFDIVEYSRSHQMQSGKTWSPILDEFYKGAVKPYFKSVNSGGSEFCDLVKNFYLGYKNADKDAIRAHYGSKRG